MAKYSFDKVAIHGFRGLRHLELNDLGLVNLLVGENNSGKTSVLEAMSILCDPYNPRQWLSMIERRDFGRLDETWIESLRWCLNQAERSDTDFRAFKGSCQWSCEGAFSVRDLRSDLGVLFGEPARQMKKGATLDDTQVAVQGNGGLSTLALGYDVPGVMITNTVRDNVGMEQSVSFHRTERGDLVESPDSTRQRIPAETLTPYSYQINKQQVIRFSEQGIARRQDNRDLVVELLQEFDADIEEVQILSLWGERPAIYLKHQKLGFAPLSTFGDAVRRAVLLATTIPALSPGGLLLIDELETGIHVSALERVFTWLMKVARRFQVQVMATTHSLEAVDAMIKAADEKLDDVMTYRLHQGEEATKAKPISGEILMRLRYESGWEVR